MVAGLREVYGQHVCDASKIITRAQLNDDGTPINDCLGHPTASTVDNIEDVDAVVGWLAESRARTASPSRRPSSQVFILNASRRLFSDRFFTSSFRPEFYTHSARLGEQQRPRRQGHGAWRAERPQAGSLAHEARPVADHARAAQRAGPVVNVFDPWARERGEYYSLAWQPRPGADWRCC
jgi:hypothetical protein